MLVNESNEESVTTVQMEEPGERVEACLLNGWTIEVFGDGQIVVLNDEGDEMLSESVWRLI